MSKGVLHNICIGAVVIAAVAVILAIGCPTSAQVDGPAFTVPAFTEDAKPRNVILVISDGCGFNHIAATSCYQHGDDDDPLYAAFPVRLAMSTPAAGGSYDPAQAAASFAYVSKGATDSAAAATAMATGVKTYGGAIGVGPDRRPVTNLTELAEAQGRSTGVVTSVQFAHATPAGFVAHNEARGNYEQIANEMILESAVDVIMGAGHPEYDNASRPVEGERDYRFVGGAGTWEALLAGTAGADADADGEADAWILVDEPGEFEALASGEAPKRVIGVAPVHTTLQQARPGDANAGAFEVPLTEGVPDLALMVRAALNVLDDDSDGLFLMVEGGAVDWASHANQGGRMIEEQLDFNRAVEAAIEWVEANSSWEETLLIVTADHETGYLTGPDADPECTAPVCRGAGVMPAIEWHSGSHTNSLVPFFARGAGAGVFEQVTVGVDPARGPYIDNTAIGQVLSAALR